jgi:single-strand DNA-binding protein
MNTVILIGRLGQDPELKYFESGSVKVRFTLAVDRSMSKENRQTDWFNIELWGKQAEVAGEWLRKGKLVSVSGQMEVQRWNDQTGNPREMPVIRASDFRMLGSAKDNATAGGGGGYVSAGASNQQNMAADPF